MSEPTNPNPTEPIITAVGGEGEPAATPPVEPQGGEPAQEPAAEPKKTILGEKEPEPEPGPTEPLALDFGDLAKELNIEIDADKNEAFKQLLMDNGITTQEQANNLVKYGLQYAAEQFQEAMILRNNNDYEETLKHYGGEGERFEEAIGKAGKALVAIEAKIPGIRKAMGDSGVDCSLPMVQLFAMLADSVGEDGNLTTGGSAAAKQISAKDFFPNTK